MNNRLVALDGMRGIAALCVFFFHAGGIPLLPRFANGYLAVDLFFLISGFILAKIYMPRFASGLPLSNFTRTRFFRFYPLYFIGFLLGLVLAVTREFFGRHTGTYGLPWGAIFAVGMLPSFNLAELPRSDLYPFNIPSWSLFFEMILNIALLPIILRIKRNNFIILLVIGFIPLSIYTVWRGEIGFGAVFDEALPGLLRSAFSFSFGGALFRWQPRTDWLPKTRLAPLVVMLFFLPEFGSGLVQAVYDLAFVAVVGPLVALSSINAPAREGALSDTYELLGRLSYPLYMVHGPVVLAYYAAQNRLQPLDIASSLLFSASLLIIVALLSSAAMLLDERLQRWFRTRFRREAAA